MSILRNLPVSFLALLLQEEKLLKINGKITYGTGQDLVLATKVYNS